MLATDYATLQTNVARYHGGGSDTQFEEAVRDSIDLAEQELDRRLWVPERVKRQFVTCSSEYEAVPIDLSRLISIRQVTGGQEFTCQQQPEDAIAQLQYATIMNGLFYSLEGKQIHLAPKPTAQAPVSIRIIYYAYLPRLSTTNPCTAVLTQYGNVYLWTSLKNLAPYADDLQGLQKWTALSDSAILEANRAAVIRDAVLGQ